MKCPRCGHEMTLDTHRKYALNMCYECGYIEGRLIDPEKKGETNFERLKKLNFNEMLAFLSKGLGMDEEKLADWLDDEVKCPAPPYFARRARNGRGVFLRSGESRLVKSPKLFSAPDSFFGECVP